MKQPIFYDKNGDAVAIGDKVTHDKQPTVPQTVVAFDCGYAENTRVSITKWSERQLSDELTKWKPVARPRTFHEIADIVGGRNEFTDTNGEDTLVGAMLHQRKDGTFRLNGYSITPWKWRPFGDTEWQDLATVEE